MAEDSCGLSDIGDEGLGAGAGALELDALHASGTHRLFEQRRTWVATPVTYAIQRVLMSAAAGIGVNRPVCTASVTLTPGVGVSQLPTRVPLARWLDLDLAPAVQKRAVNDRFLDAAFDCHAGGFRLWVGSVNWDASQLFARPRGALATLVRPERR